MAESRAQLDGADAAYPAQDRGEHRQAQPELGADQLTYMADMVSELQEMARRGRFETLATILGLAGVEATRLAASLRP